MKKYLGIWLDQKKAILFSFDAPEKDPEISCLGSEIETHNRPPESQQTETPYSTRHSRTQQKMENRRHNELIEFLNDILKEIRSADQIAIAGPSLTRLQFKNYLEKFPEANAKLVDVSPLEQKSDAYLIDYFRNIFLKTPTFHI